MKRRLLEHVWALRRRLATPMHISVRPAPAGETIGRALEWSATVREGDESIGHGYLERWRRSGRSLVSPVGEAGTSLRIFSHNAPDTPPATHPHVIVEARDLVIDFGRMGERDQLAFRPGYLRVRGGYSDYRRGALRAAGATDGDMGPDLFPRDHLRDIFDSLEMTEEALAVDDTIEEPCLFITREPREHGNLFHGHTDWLSAYSAIRLLGLEDVKKRVVLLDPHSESSLDTALGRLFSASERASRRSDFGSARIRFRHAVFVPPGYSSVLWARQHAGASGPPVGLLQDYGRFFRSAFCPCPAVAPESPVRATLLTRRPYPGRGPVLLRQFQSEEALAAALGSIPDLTVEVVDFAALSLSDQVRIAATTEILVGAHGAGLAHTFAMAEHGAVVEIVGAPAPSASRLYANLAAWTDRLYARIEAPERLGWGGSWLDPEPQALRACVLGLAALVRERRPARAPTLGETGRD